MLLCAFLALLLGHSLVAKRLEKTAITPPMLFAVAGMIMPWLMPELQEGKGNIELFLVMAEAGLVLLLFTDASRTDLRVLSRIRGLPTRLLSVGMLLTLLLGTGLAWLVLPSLSIWEAGILAAILAPTDAGLGQVIVTSPRVPMQVRQALNVEAGLNDGLSVPFLLFFIGVAGSASGGDQPGLLKVTLEQLGLGGVVGIGVGLSGGWLLRIATRKGWMTAGSEPLAVVALPLLSAVVSEEAGASMFIAAFVAGLTVQSGFKNAAQHSVEFTEALGQLLNLSVFFSFGVLVVRNSGSLTVSSFIYAILSLTAVRLLPVAGALIGTGLSRATVLFMGWFGPRGLASIVLTLVYIQREPHLPGETVIRAALIATVLLSIVAHGLTAKPGIALYAAQMAALAPDAPERRDLSGPANPADPDGRLPKLVSLAGRDREPPKRTPGLRTP